MESMVEKDCPRAQTPISMPIPTLVKEIPQAPQSIQTGGHGRVRMKRGGGEGRR
jgi:hypothetical protein